MGTKVSDMQKNVTPGRRKGCPNYPPEFKQLLVAASCEPGISISKLALENGINANLLFKWRQQWREGKLLLPSSESPQLLREIMRATVFNYIECDYNRWRRHSWCGGLSPEQFENQNLA
ncbi:hypothetical protein ETE51_10965 [Escherichia coli]|nr:hypothetical protein ETE51_10965 [Escherichia coli]